MYAQLFRNVYMPFFEGVIKGRSTVKYWQQFEERQWRSRQEHEADQLTALIDLTRHAFQTCPYYLKTWSERGLDPQRLQSFADFQHWPLIDRDTIKANRMQMRSTIPQPMMTKSTGGSSGQPLHFDLNRDSHDRRTAMMHRGYSWAGGEPGSKQLFIWGGPLAHLTRWKRLKEATHRWLERKLLIDCFQFSEKQMHRHARSLNRFRPDVIIAYTTPLYEMARFLSEQKIPAWSPKGLIVGAEKLQDEQRRVMEQVFQCPVFETYGSREFMLMGAECEKHRGLHLSMENLYLEVVDDDGRLTPDGEEGNVAVTDLFNYGMPFIRYLNGDRAIAGWENCDCGRGLPMLRKVTGRATDMLFTRQGRRIPGTFFPHVMKEFANVRKFQVEQTTLDQIIVRLIAPQLTANEQAKLQFILEGGIGPETKLELQRVDEIPLTAAGKHQVVINRCRPVRSHGPAESRIEAGARSACLSHAAAASTED